MKQFAMTCQLKNRPGVIEQYENYHANPWPEVSEGTLSCGVHRVFIYRTGHLLFMFMETGDDFEMERDLPKYRENPKVREWDELMRTLQTNTSEAKEGTTWVPMKEVYALERPNRT